MKRSLNSSFYKILIAIFLLLLINKSNAQEKKPSAIKAKTTRILFLLDASGSMQTRWKDGIRMDAAKKILAETIDSLKRKPDLEMGIRVYGSMSNTLLKDCNDTKLLVPFGKMNISYLKSALTNLQPNGITPIALSLEKAAYDFPKDSNSRNVIILITDGEESCGGDPCAVSLALQKEHIIIKPFIIGLNMTEELGAKFSCLGNFFNTDSPEELRVVIKNIVAKVLASTNVVVNLLDQQHNATETDVNMTFYDAQFHQPKYNYYHTITYKGTPDTVSLDPVLNYDLEVHTVPPLELKNILLVTNKNNVIEISAPQGFLKLGIMQATINNNVNNKIRCLVRKHNEGETMRVQNINTVEKFICGMYDLEFLTLPRTTISNVEIAQSKTTLIQIPTPGILNINKSSLGYGAIFTTDKNRLQKIYELSDKVLNETIALQPGTYRIIYRTKFSKKTTESVEKTFQILSAGSVQVKL